MTTLIFDNQLTGHHPEYLNYLYYGACQRKDENFVFSVPESGWLKIKDTCQWPEADNIRFRFLSDEELATVSDSSKFTKSLSLSKLIKKVAVEENVDRIKLISLADVVPFLPLMLPKSIKLSGIIYKIYLRNNPSAVKKAVDFIRYSVMARCSTVEKVHILNDPRSALKLNEIYSTDKFVTLADPVPQPDMQAIENLREKLGIPADAKVYLHFGAMDERKGTLEILKAIQLLPDEDLHGRYFIFAGKINSRIKDAFHHLAEKCREEGANIIIDDRFCPYGYLFSLCNIADCILIPYLLTDLSSGALGYASVFNKPVIGPSSGLIGSLIKDNNLGICLDKVTPESIAGAITEDLPSVKGREYAEKNSIRSFTHSLLS